MESFRIAANEVKVRGAKNGKIHEFQPRGQGVRADFVIGDVHDTETVRTKELFPRKHFFIFIPDLQLQGLASNVTVRIERTAQNQRQ